MAAITEIRLECQGCRKDCRATISSGTTSAKFRCSACGRILFEARAIEGYVFVLSHPRMEGLVRVGFTKRLVAEEVQELNWVSGLPEHFVVEASYESSSPEKHAAEIHKRLATRHVKGMEYFEMTVSAALRLVQDVVQPRPLDGAGGPVLSRAEPIEPSPVATWLWVCGLCKHQWTVTTTPDRCPLCQSASIVRLSAAA
ncbi:hypothetical protein SBA2_840011 [Acidobacteriia bacterium SbA2]|nr:hypothetical protein SBA2_840011 [Acidobacteriia bacterium SbA2]